LGAAGKYPISQGFLLILRGFPFFLLPLQQVAKTGCGSAIQSKLYCARFALYSRSELKNT